MDNWKPLKEIVGDNFKQTLKFLAFSIFKVLA